MSLGGKYVFAIDMSLVLHMCILISCSSVLCVLMALGMFMFVIDQCDEPPSSFVLYDCAYGCVVGYFSCLCEFSFLYCDVRLGVVHEVFLVPRFCF